MIFRTVAKPIPVKSFEIWLFENQLPEVKPKWPVSPNINYLNHGVFIYILAAGNHFRNYYIHGEFPLCELEKEDMKRCFSHKFNRDAKDEVCNFSLNLYPSESCCFLRSDRVLVLWRLSQVLWIFTIPITLVPNVWLRVLIRD